MAEKDYNETCIHSDPKSYEKPRILANRVNPLINVCVTM